MCGWQKPVWNDRFRFMIEFATWWTRPNLNQLPSTWSPWITDVFGAKPDSNPPPERSDPAFVARIKSMFPNLDHIKSHIHIYLYIIYRLSICLYFIQLGQIWPFGQCLKKMDMWENGFLSPSVSPPWPKYWPSPKATGQTSKEFAIMQKYASKFLRWTFSNIYMGAGRMFVNSKWLVVILFFWSYVVFLMFVY